MQDVLEAWAERVAEAMHEKRLTMGELARRCDVDVSTISRFVSGMPNGERRNPNDELKWKIAGVLGLRMDRLFAYPAVIPPAPAARPERVA